MTFIEFLQWLDCHQNFNQQGGFVSTNLGWIFVIDKTPED